MPQVASGTLVIYPQLDTSVKSAITKQLSGIDATSSGKKVGKSLGTSIVDSSKAPINSIGVNLKSVLGAAGSIAAAIGFGSIVSEAGAAADATAKFKQTLDFANVDTAQIDALTESTKKYADQTVYDLADIQNITAQLAANAVPNYDKLAEAAGNLNAVAGGNADTFKSVGMVLTQTAGAGKLTTENWNQLADAIPGASGKLQEAMLKNGAYTGNFRDAMAQGQITADEFNQAIMDLGFQDAAVEAAQSTKTFEGAIGNLQATVVGGVGELLTTLQPAITGLINMANEALTPVFEGINTSVTTFVDTLNSTGDPVQALGAAFDTFAPQAKAAAIAIGLIGTALTVGKIASTGAKVASAMKGIGSAVASIAGKGASAAAGLIETAAGETAAGAAGATSATQILAAAAAVIALGAGVALASAGLWLLANAAIQIATAGAPAAIVLAGMVAAVAGLAVGAAALAPALTAGAVGFAAFGAAILMVGAGIALATSGLALLSTQLPIVSEYGTSAAVGFAAIGAAALVMAPGLLAAGTALTVFGAGLAVTSAAALALGAAILVASAGIVVASAGVAVLAATLPAVAASGAAAAAGMAAVSAAGLAMGAALTVAGAGALVFAAGAIAAGAGATVLSVGLIAAGAGVTVAAAGMGLLAAAVNALAGGVDTTAKGIAKMGKNLPIVGSAAPAAAGGMTALGAACGVVQGAMDGAGNTSKNMASSFKAAVASTTALGAAFALVPAIAAAGSKSMAEFGDSATKAGAGAVAAIRAACAAMQSEVANCKLVLPKIQVGALPHFFMNGKFNPKTGSVPSVGVNWYATGGLFDGASIVGIGEHGTEAVVPLTSRRMLPFADAIADGIEKRFGAETQTHSGDTYIFNNPVKSPAETARAIRMQKRYGLAGAR